MSWRDWFAHPQEPGDERRRRQQTESSSIDRDRLRDFVEDVQQQRVRASDLSDDQRDRREDYQRDRSWDYDDRDRGYDRS